MDRVTVERIARVQAHILDATLSTSENSTLSGPEQDGLLAQSCAEACDLLRDWLESGWFSQVRPSGDGLLAEVVPTAEQFSQFLGPSSKTPSAMPLRRESRWTPQASRTLARRSRAWHAGTAG